MLPFTAFCARGHDRIDFTDRDAFDAHMATEHGRRKGYAGKADDSTDGKPAPGWGAAGILAPHPWVAPRRTPGGLTKVTQRIAAGEYAWPHRWGPGYGAGEPAAELPDEAWERLA